VTYLRDGAMKLSARNKLKGKIVRIDEGMIAAKIQIEVSGPATITSVITKDAMEDLSIKEGDEVEAIIKSTEVLIGKD